MKGERYAGLAVGRLRIPEQEAAARRQRTLNGASPWRAAAATAHAALHGTLPPRYLTDTWRDPFDSRLASLLRPNLRILDVGAGRSPVVPPGERPAGSHYVGLDIAATELRAAPAGSYDEAVVADATRRVPSLHASFDLILSWFALEHVKPLDAALANLHSYLRPGGRLLAHLSGRFAAFSLLNRALPARLSGPLMKRMLGREPDTVFPAAYDRCWYGALRELLAPRFSEFEIVPLYTGGYYFTFSRTLSAAYLAYEEWASRARRANLAPYYLIEAVG